MDLNTVEFCEETTVWAGNTPNHIYVLDAKKTKLYAYIRSDSNEHQIFAKPIPFDPRGRTFRSLGKVSKFKS